MFDQIRLRLIKFRAQLESHLVSPRVPGIGGGKVTCVLRTELPAGRFDRGPPTGVGDPPALLRCDFAGC